jgi:predicted Rossmann-fold nucleotide-binding protein
LDELFEALTLIQTQKMQGIPIILFGNEFWNSLINWNQLVDDGLISPEDVDLFKIVETAQEGIFVIT